MRKYLLVGFLFSCLAGTSPVYGEKLDIPGLNIEDLANIKFETPDVAGFKTKLNLYSEYEYTWMSDMPMVMPGSGMMASRFMFMQMDRIDLFTNRHFTFLADAEKDDLRLHVNYDMDNWFSEGNNDNFEHGLARMMEYYGEYTFDDALKLRAGKFLAPFGIYNDIRYISPLFATVVLPTIYDQPFNYGRDKFYPPDPNFMLSGRVYPFEEMELGYSAYYGSGPKDDRGVGFEGTPSFGSRITATFFDNLKLGLSGYTFESAVRQVALTPTMVEYGRENTYGLDFEYAFLNDKLTLQAEFVKSTYDDAQDRKSYYGRLMYALGRFTPFIMFDRLEDDAHFLYQYKMDRWGAGTSVRLTNNSYFKLEYHIHSFDDRAVPKVLRNQTMIRSSFILAF